ncbi:hypothetical protein G6O69_38885 [Pseudenhygromyxa sp. WMMC2535]|uniref:hypothetical protein n=1 Tax=Pseudenhygromyxa sp. WMMC2535 TaxID=2712867 RepID=UPI001595E8DB|nr:hypothetical protein [Pseudenhygromyxa sp. WMMC2535]NVB43825.1 hypothetical protein [Pseudenhygromyxa sp. WMMC2535]
MMTKQLELSILLTTGVALIGCDQSPEDYENLEDLEELVDLQDVEDASQQLDERVEDGEGPRARGSSRRDHRQPRPLWRADLLTVHATVHGALGRTTCFAGSETA